MGRAKELWIERQNQKHTNLPDWDISVALFPHHKLIREFISKEGYRGRCHYTGRIQKVLPVVRVVEFIESKFRELYEDPAEECGYESHDPNGNELKGTGWHKDEGYFLPDSRKMQSTEDVFYHEGFSTADEELTNIIINSMVGTRWVPVDPYGDNEAEAGIYDWQRFKEATIKDAKSGVPYDQIYLMYEPLLERFISTILQGAEEHITSLGTDVPIFRCVNYNLVPNPLTISELGAPPSIYASSNRMSRQGQSRLYVSFDSQTPLSEAVGASLNKSHCLGEFTFKHKVKVLDLCKLPLNLFLNVENYWGFRFLQQFAEAIRYHVPATDQILYTPTQIMTDYIEKNVKVSGIIYPSSKRDDYRNLVMFYDQRKCANHLDLIKTSIIK